MSAINRLTATRTTIGMIVLCLSFACAAIEPLPTASGRPEVTISGVTCKQVSDRIVNNLLNNGATIKTATESMVVAEKRTKSEAARLFYGSQYDTEPMERAIFNVVGQDDSVRVVVTMQCVTNPGSAFERITELNAGATWGHKAQAALDSMKTNMEAPKPPQ